LLLTATPLQNSLLELYGLVSFIDEAMTRTRQQLLENFDAEVIEKLRISRDSSTAYLDHYERMLMELTHHELRDHIKVLDGVSSFQLTSCPFDDDIPPGLYELPRRSGEAYLYRLSHPLAQHVLSQAKGRALPPAEMTFDYTNYLPIISILKPLVGQEGLLRLSLLTIESLDQDEDYLIVAALADNGQSLDVEQATRLLRLPARYCRHLKTIERITGFHHHVPPGSNFTIGLPAERGLLRSGSQ
jgi:SNF2-related domain